MLPAITLEEHFVSKSIAAWGKDSDPKNPEPAYDIFPDDVRRKLFTLGSERLADMERANIALQIISHGPTRRCPPPDICRKANLELADAVCSNKNRLAGFAVLPMEDPSAATDELDYCVKQLQFLGALVNNQSNGHFYDGTRYWPVFAKAQELDVPIYIHPTYATLDAVERSSGNWGHFVAESLANWGWGWHSDTAVHILRLFASGLFDKYPSLKIIIGHDGEMLPFQLERILPMSRKWGLRERDLLQVWTNNIWVTTSGMFSTTPFECLRRTLPISHILFSIDYPFCSNEQGRAFLEEIEKSGALAEEEVAMFAYKNAEKLLKVTLQE
jgi:predicted TIM-barrel fold metal-dependent hydrolase